MAIHRFQHLFKQPGSKPTEQSLESSCLAPEAGNDNIAKVALTGEEARALFSRMCSTADANKVFCKEIALKSFEEFVTDLENKSDKLSTLDKSKIEYKETFYSLAKEFEERISELCSSNEAEKCEDILSKFIGSRLTTEGLDKGNTVLATIFLNSDQKIVKTIVQDFLTADPSKNLAAKKFINIVRSAMLFEDEYMYQTLCLAAIEVANENISPEDQQRAISQLISLTPGSEHRTKMENLLAISLAFQEQLVDNYESLFAQLQIHNDADDDSDLITLSDTNTNPDESERRLLQQMANTKAEILKAHKFINILYGNNGIQKLLSGSNLLDQINQRDPLNALDKHDFSDILEPLEKESIATLFSGPILQSAVNGAVAFAKKYPTKLNKKQVQNKLEEVIFKLTRYADFYLKPLTTAVEVYWRNFSKPNVNDFLINSLKDAGTSDLLRYRVIEKIARTKSFKSLLKAEIQRGQKENLETLFSIAYQKIQAEDSQTEQDDHSEEISPEAAEEEPISEISSGDKAYKPLQNILKDLSYEEFSKAMDSLEGATLLEISKDMEEVRQDNYHKEKFLEVVARQFDWNDIENPISIKLIQYLIDICAYDWDRSGEEEIQQFLRFTLGEKEADS